MPNTEGSTGQPICVLFGEAIAWIAVRNFTGAVAIGPRPLGLLPCGDGDDDEEYRIAEGRSILAQELLIDRAAKGRITDGRMIKRSRRPCLFRFNFRATF